MLACARILQIASKHTGSSEFCMQIYVALLAGRSLNFAGSDFNHRHLQRILNSIMLLTRARLHLSAAMKMED